MDSPKRLSIPIPDEDVVEAAPNLPFDILLLIAKFLSVTQQFRLGLADTHFREVVWCSRTSYPGWTFIKEAEFLHHIAALPNQPGFVANVVDLTLDYSAVDLALFIPLAVRLNTSTRLTSVLIEATGNGAEIFTIFGMSTAPLETLTIMTTTGVYDRVPHISLKHMSGTLRHLRLFNEDSLPVSKPFLEYLACQLPNLQLLSVPANPDCWDPLKTLTQLTHLQVQVARYTMNSLFAVASVAQARKSVEKLLSLTPPKVGVNLLLNSKSDTYYRILERAIEDKASQEIVRALIDAGGKDQLTFMHQTYVTLIDSISSFLSYADCRSSELLELIVTDFQMPLQWDVVSYRSRYKQSLFVEFLEHFRHSSGLEMSQWLFGKPWDQALKQGHNPAELLLDNRHNPPQSVAFSLYRMYDDAVRYLWGRRDVFGDVAALRDEQGRTLLFFASSAGETKDLLSAGVDWRHTDFTGQTAVHRTNLDALHSIKIIVESLSDEEFVEWCTPLGWARLGQNPAAEERMRALVPRDQWQPCLRAAIQFALLRSRRPVFHSDPEVKRMQIEAWLDPIDAALFSHFPAHKLALETVHLAYLVDETASFAQLILNEIAKDLGPFKAAEWATKKDRNGQPYCPHPLLELKL